MDSFISKVKKLPQQISHGAQTALTPFKKHQKDNAKRIKLQKELFAFTRCTENGFPHKASAIAHDPKLNLLAIGTKVGYVRIYGAPGVEFACRLCPAESELEVRNLIFVNGEARLLALCSDNSVHLLEINSDTETQIGYLEDVQHVAFASKEVAPLSYVTALCLNEDASRLICGTEGGSLLAINMKDFVHDEQFTVSYEQLTEKVNEASVKESSPVRTIAMRGSMMLIAFVNGLTVQYDAEKKLVSHAYYAAQPTEHLDWYSTNHFATSHADGSYLKWSLSPAVDEQPESVTVHKPAHPPTMPYGPYACNPMKKLVFAAGKHGDCVMFADGMSSAQYGEKMTLTVMRDGEHIAFDFTSKLVDFVVLYDEAQVDAHSTTVVVLLEEELLAIDLEDQRWRLLQNPYVHTMHSSAITCAHHFANLSESLWNRLHELGAKQTNEVYSSRTWPINGGLLLPVSAIVKTKETVEPVAAEKTATAAAAAPEPAPAPSDKENEAPKDDAEKANEESAPKATEEAASKTPEQEATKPKTVTLVANVSVPILRRDVFVTGHEDGSVIFWNASEPAIKPLYKLSTSKIFADYVGAPDEHENADAAAQDWPPFRKVGMFDPFSDDPRLAIQRIFLNESNEELIVGGTAGQLLVLTMRPDARELRIVEKSQPEATPTSAEDGAAVGAEVKQAQEVADVDSVKVVRLDFVEADGTFVWKGHDALKLVDAETPLPFAAGYQPRIVVQVHPPVPISALDVHADWHLAALGTAHGYAVIDLLRAAAVKAQTTLTSATVQQAVAPENTQETQPSSASQQPGKIATLRRTIRESFRAPVRQVRRVFKRTDETAKKRDSKTPKKEETAVPAVTVTEPTAEVEPTNSTVPATIPEEAPAAAATTSTEEQQPAASSSEAPAAVEIAAQPAPDVTLTSSAQPEASVESAPAATEDAASEKAAEDKPAAVEGEQVAADGDAEKAKQEEAPAKTACFLTPEMRSTALVRYLTFAETFVSDEKRTPVATLWIGTNGGTVHLCTIAIKDAKLNELEAAKRETIQCELAKTLQLQHAAPIVFLALLNHDYVPLACSASEKLTEGRHRLLVCTEQQLKLFNSVTLKPKVKAKLHAPHRNRRCALAKFVSRTDERHSEHALISLSNEGQIIVSDLHHLRRQLVVDDALPHGDMVALNSCLFTSHAHGIYQCSSSEFATFSLSARYANAPRCTVEPVSGVRPLKTKPSVIPRVLVGETLCAAAAVTSQPNAVAAATEVQTPAASDEQAPAPAPAPAATTVESDLAEDINREIAKREADLDKSADVTALTEHDLDKSRTLPTDITMDIIVDYTKPKQIDDDPKKTLAEHAEHQEPEVVS